MTHYRFDPETGLWHHRDGAPEPVRSLGDIAYRTGKLEYRAHHVTEPEWVLGDYLEEARTILDAAASVAPVAAPALSDDFERLRWFPLPADK